MPESTETTEPKKPTLGQEIARSSAISLVSSAASMVGLIGGLVIVNKLMDRKSKETDTENTTESETTES